MGEHNSRVRRNHQLLPSNALIESVAPRLYLTLSAIHVAPLPIRCWRYRAGIAGPKPTCGKLTHAARTRFKCAGPSAESALTSQRALAACRT